MEGKQPTLPHQPIEYHPAVLIIHFLGDFRYFSDIFQYLRDNTNY